MAKVLFNNCVNVLITKLTQNKYKLYLQVVILGVVSKGTVGP